MNALDVDALQRGFRMRMPAGPGAIFSAQAAEGLRGQVTSFDAVDFGIGTCWKMRIADAFVVEDGAAIVVTYEPLRLVVGPSRVQEG